MEVRCSVDLYMEWDEASAAYKVTDSAAGVNYCTYVCVACQTVNHLVPEIYLNNISIHFLSHRKRRLYITNNSELML